jgi:hypothetical protein
VTFQGSSPAGLAFGPRKLEGPAGVCRRLQANYGPAGVIDLAQQPMNREISSSRLIRQYTRSSHTRKTRQERTGNVQAPLTIGGIVDGFSEL